MARETSWEAAEGCTFIVDELWVVSLAQFSGESPWKLQYQGFLTENKTLETLYPQLYLKRVEHVHTLP